MESDGALRIAQPPIAVFLSGEQAYAIDDTCPHRGCPLSGGSLDGTTVTCSCHGSQFDVTSGALVSGPATFGVSTYPARLDGDTVLVDLPD